MVSRSQISEHLAMYLNGKIPLDLFEDWVVENTWNIHLDRDVEAMQLAYAIEESLAEYSSGHISESQLRDEFKVALYSERPVVEVHYFSPRPAMQSVSRNSDAFLSGEVVTLDSRSGLVLNLSGSSAQGHRWQTVQV